MIDAFCSYSHVCTGLSCSSDEVTFNGNCYFGNTSNLVNYSTSALACTQRNSALLGIDSYDEQKFIELYIQKLQRTNSKLWMGIHQKTSGSSQYYAAINGEISYYRNWFCNFFEQAKVDGFEPGFQIRHLRKVATNFGKWMDATFDKVGGYLCEREPPIKGEESYLFTVCDCLSSFEFLPTWPCRSGGNVNSPGP